MTGARPKLATLESLRGLLALWVVVAHVTARVISESSISSMHAQAPLEPLLPVYVFMILSGFVIFSLLQRGDESYGVFILRRFFRLAPLFFLVLLVAASLQSFELRTLEHLFWRNGHIDDSIRIHRDALAHFWPHFWAHATLLHGLVPDTLLRDANFSLLSQGWSISLEWQFYLLAPLIFLLISRRRYLAIGLLATIIAALGALHYPSIGFLPNQFAYFALGIASFYLYRACGWLARIPPRTHDLLLPIVGLSLYALLRQPLPVLVWVLVFDAVLARHAGLETPLTSRVNRLLEWPVLQWLGRISYSVYLVHITIMYGVFRAITHFNDHLGGLKFLALALPATVMLTLIVAAVTYRWIEVPGIALGRTIGNWLERRPLRQQDPAYPHPAGG
jgi:peptidoglycan/LPS O-acetylase OafA/YrhL